MNLKTSAIFTGLILLSALSMSVAQTVNPLVHTPNGYVYDLDAEGDTLIVAGRFGHVGKPTGSIAQVTTTNDQINPNFPKIENGDVRALVTDGAGGYFVLQNNPYRISHILPNNTFDPNFNIAPLLYWPHKILYHNNVIYVSNNANYDTAGGLVAFNTTTQQQLQNIPFVDGNVNNMRIDGDKLYIMGGFDSVAQQSRQGIACIDLSSHTLTNWYPQLPQPQNSPPTFSDIVFHGNNAVIGGSYANSGYPSDITKCLIVNKHSGTFVKFLFQGGGLFGGPLNNMYWAASVQRMAISGNTLLMATGGTYDTRITACNLLLDSNYVTWARFFNMIAHVYDIVVSGNTVYVAGEYIDEVYLKDSVNGNAANIELHDAKNAVAFNIATGAIQNWHPNPISGGGHWIEAMVLQGNDIVLGGRFSHLNGYDRNYVYLYNTASEAVLPFSIQASAAGRVNKVKLLDSLLYVAADFDSAWGAGNRITTRAYNIHTGQKSDWYPKYLGEASAIEVGDQFVFLGGGSDLKDSIGNTLANSLIALDRSTGSVINWTPNPEGNSEIRSMLLVDNILYVAGNFENIAGQNRKNIAAFDATTLQLLPWNPDSVGVINNMKSNDSLLFVTQDKWNNPYGFIGLSKSDGSIKRRANDPNMEFEAGDIIIKNKTVLTGLKSDNECNIRSYKEEDMKRDTSVCVDINLYGRTFSTELIGNDLYFGGDFIYTDNQLLGTNLCRISFPSNYFDDSTTSIIDRSKYISVNIYPNPANNYIHIETTENLSNEIFSIDGRLAMLRNNNKVLNVGALAPGVYIINLYNKKGLRVGVGKFVKE